jgi:hypothetical protein
MLKINKKVVSDDVTNEDINPVLLLWDEKNQTWYFSFASLPIRWPDILRKDTLPKDILHFADGRFAEQTFCRTDVLTNGQLVENRDIF